MEDRAPSWPRSHFGGGGKNLVPVASFTHTRKCKAMVHYLCLLPCKVQTHIESHPRYYLWGLNGKCRY